jgi:hypothetical protein
VPAALPSGSGREINEEAAVSGEAAVTGEPAQGSSVAGPDDESGQHYESFVVRVLFNDDRSIRDTRMEHIGTGAVKRWAAWEPAAMLAFIQAVANPPLSAPVEDDVGGPAPARRRRAPATAKTAGQPAKPARRPASTAPAGPARAAGAEPVTAAPVARLCTEREVIRAAEPFAVKLIMDLSRAAVAGDRLAYSAVVVARQLGGGHKETLASASGLLATGGRPAIQVDAGGLPPGLYRLEGAVSLRAPGGSPAGALAATAEGIFLHVIVG